MKYAILLLALTGCAGITPNGMIPREQVDLNHFIVDCNNKQAQIEFLQSLRPTLYQRQVQQIKDGGERSDYEWLIDYNLKQLSYCDNNRVGKYRKAPSWND